MYKRPYIREEDQWLFLVTFLTVLAGAAGWYASVLTFRGPALVLFGLGAWFTYVKIRNGYSLKRARFHLLITFLLSIIVACIVYLLTK